MYDLDSYVTIYKRIIDIYISGHRNILVIEYFLLNYMAYIYFYLDAGTGYLKACAIAVLIYIEILERT
jgi:hypothetical protein